MKKYIHNRAKAAVSLMLFYFLCSPYALAASGTGWLTTLNQYTKAIQIGLYALAGTVVLVCITISGIRWQAARMSGSHEKTFMNYIEDLMVVMFVGGGVALATAAWQIWGSGTPGA